VRTIKNLMVKRVAAAASAAGASFDLGKALPKAFADAKAELAAQKNAAAADVAQRGDDGDVSYDEAVAVAVKTKVKELETEPLDDVDQRVLDAIADVDAAMAKELDALGPDQAQALQGDPQGAYVKSLAKALGVTAATAVKEMERVRVKVRKLVEVEEVVQRFQYWCPYCNQVEGASCAFMKMPMDWKVQHSKRKPWTETNKRTAVVEEEI
jgi:hypothetical protein